MFKFRWRKIPNGAIFINEKLNYGTRLMNRHAWDSEGYFGILHIPNQDLRSTHPCREVTDGFFHDFKLATTKEFQLVFIKNCPINLVKLKEFFDIVEKSLGISNSITFTPSQYNYCICVNWPTDFWHKNVFRFSVLTLLLRCAIVYYNEKTSLDEALRNYKLANLVFNEVKYFLSGNTVLKPQFLNQYQGFVATCQKNNFKDIMSKEEVQNLSMS